MPKLDIEWQVDLKHTGYHLNGRGSTPHAALTDLIERAGRQKNSAQDEVNRLTEKISNLDGYLAQLGEVK